MLGVTWDASARTSGTIQYGNQTKKFDDPGKEEYDGSTWLATVSWRPRTYSVFTLRATQDTHEPNGRGDYILRRDAVLSWVHNWAARFSTTADIGVGTDAYKPTTREDDLFYWGALGRYTFNQHFRLGASVRSYDRDSDEARFNYTRTVYMLTLEATY